MSSDATALEARRTLLDRVLNLIVPPSEDGRFPGADAVGVFDHLRLAPQLVPALCEELDRIEAEARSQFGAPFPELSAADQRGLVDRLRASDPRFLRRLALETVTCYYQDPRVLAALGMEARAPFPLGYDVVAGDLSLLDPVRARGKRYRDAD